MKIGLVARLWQSHTTKTQPWRWDTHMKVSLIALLVLTVPLAACAQSTSPNFRPAVQMQSLGLAQPVDSDTITFSEYAIGTAITVQYRDVGIIFGGSGPFISPDGANPTSPVLSGSPRFEGDIAGTFVVPGTDEPTVVHSFTLDAGYFDEYGSTRIEWFDPEGKKLGQRINSHLGIERFTIEGGSIASWRIGTIRNEPAGFAIDNVSFDPVGPSVLFREKSDETKEGTWGLQKDEIPGFDHCGFQFGNKVYESHPGYFPSGDYISADGKESAPVLSVFGVQAQHSRATFEHDSTTSSTSVVDFREIPVAQDLATRMRDAIDAVMGRPFQQIDYSFDGLASTLAPAVQKGGRGAFTCVGLVEWSAEQAGCNGGQGFIRNSFESITVLDPRPGKPWLLEVPLLSPQLLYYAMSGQQLLQGAKQWVEGLLDPVDFLLTDPLGRQLGFVTGAGLIDQIPNAFYSGDGGVEQFLIANAIPGVYALSLVGADSEAFAAVGASGSSISFAGFMPSGTTADRQLRVEPTPGCGGDVDGDGDVDSSDIDALVPLLNRFTDGLGHPGDLDGDGLLSDIDVSLLSRLVDVLGDDTVPPVIAGLEATPNVLWPPKHNMVPVTITVDASDNSDPAPASRIVEVTSNEPANGTGDGDTSPDWAITGDLTLMLRAERAGGGAGRIYSVTVECADASGNASTSVVQIRVPHDRR